MDRYPIQYYRTALGARETLDGKTCADCCRFAEYRSTSVGGDQMRGRCRVTQLNVTAAHFACVVFPLVNGWQLINCNSSSPSDDPPKPGV